MKGAAVARMFSRDQTERAKRLHRRQPFPARPSVDRGPAPITAPRPEAALRRCSCTGQARKAQRHAP